MRSDVAVANTLNRLRLVDGGSCRLWAPKEPEWDDLYEAYGRLARLSEEGYGCPLPPVSSCWVYLVWRAGRGFSPAGLRRDRCELMVELATGVRAGRGLAMTHLCGRGGEGCINPFHLAFEPIGTRAGRVPSFGELIEIAKSA